MNIINFLELVGESKVIDAGSYGSTIIDTVNSLLFENKQPTVEPQQVTGSSLLIAISKLSIDVRSKLCTHQLFSSAGGDEGVNYGNIRDAMCVDNIWGYTPRSIIALMMATIAGIFILVVASAITYVALVTGGYPSWELIGVVLAIPAALLRSYFGQASSEQVNAVQVAAGKPAPPTLSQQLGSWIITK